MKKIIPMMALAMVGAALAQTPVQKPVLKLENYDVRTVVEDGKTVEKLTLNKGSVYPGNTLAQLVTVTNPNKIVLPVVEVRLPVPKNTVFAGLEPVPVGVKATFSIDGGKTFAAAPLKKKVTVVENGKSVTKEVEVKPSEYEAVRWSITNMAAGQTMKVGFRIQVR